eukprot:scaffold14723_cov282-Ochromonas_danica.AAC.4
MKKKTEDTISSRDTINYPFQLVCIEQILLRSKTEKISTSEVFSQVQVQVMTYGGDEKEAIEEEEEKREEEETKAEID